MDCTPSSTPRAQGTPDFELRDDPDVHFSQMGELRDTSEFFRYWYASTASGGSGGLSGYATEDGKLLQMWSIMSTTKDQYVTMGKVTDGSPVVVKANGSAATSSMKFDRIKPEILLYNISFENNSDYYLNGIETGRKVEAVQVNNRSNAVKSIWKIYQVDILNHYFAVGLIEGNETHAKLFLSSDGKGNMKLKPRNTHPFPVTKSLFIDPALLFRLVEP